MTDSTLDALEKKLRDAHVNGPVPNADPVWQQGFKWGYWYSADMVRDFAKEMPVAQPSDDIRVRVADLILRLEAGAGTPMDRSTETAIALELRAILVKPSAAPTQGAETA